MLENIAEGRMRTGSPTDWSRMGTRSCSWVVRYQNGGIQIARRNPDVSIIHASGFMVEPNFSPFTAKYWQGTYLMGWRRRR